MTMTTNKKKILIADDEAAIRQLLTRMLSKEYCVIEAQNGEIAVSIARQEKPDLVLMDMMMPKMDGLTACSAIKQDQATKGISVVMLTAIGYSLNRKLAEQVAGADGYITKPFDSQELLCTVGRLLSLRSQVSDKPGTQVPNNV